MLPRHLNMARSKAAQSQVGGADQVMCGGAWHPSSR